MRSFKSFSYLPRGMVKEEWSLMEMIPGYEEPPPPPFDPFSDETPPDEKSKEEAPPKPPKITYLNLFKKKKSQVYRFI